MRRALIAVLSCTLLLSALVIGIIASGSAAQEDPSPEPRAADREQRERQPEGGVRLRRAHNPTFSPLLDRRQPIFILVLGSDTRSKQDHAITHSKCDSIHIVGLNTARHQASILGFPRDAWVNLAQGGQGRINEMCYPGPENAIATMEALTGIRFDYYAVAGFYDFRDIVSGVGNVTVDLPYAIDDDHSKAHFREGRNVMSGKEALRYVRSRYSVPGGDFGRSENQGHFLIQMLAQYQKQARNDPSVLFRYLGVTMAQLKTDLTADELLHLAFTITQVDPERIVNKVVPGGIGTHGDASTVDLSPAAQAMYADLAKDGMLRP